MTVLFKFNLQTKFETKFGADAASYISSKDMAWAQNVEMGHVTLTMPTWGTISHHKANTSRGQLVYEI